MSWLLPIHGSIFASIRSVYGASCSLDEVPPQYSGIMSQVYLALTALCRLEPTCAPKNAPLTKPVVPAT